MIKKKKGSPERWVLDLPLGQETESGAWTAAALAGIVQRANSQGKETCLSFKQEMVRVLAACLALAVAEAEWKKKKLTTENF